MRYNNLSPKFFYYLNLGIVFTALLLLTFLLYVVVHLDNIIVFLIVSSVMMLVGLQFFFIVNKMIYAKVDPEKQILIFGALLFQNEIVLSKVKYVKHIYPFKIVKLKIENKNFYYLEYGLGGEEIFEALSKI